MSDLIRRQDAIDAILAVTGNSSVRELYEHIQEHGLSEMWSGGVNAAIDIIIAVPPVQPEPCEDTISRKAAIDTVKHAWAKGLEPTQYIEDLPSAQPERTCVNCGRTANNGGWYADGRTRCPIEEHYALPKDGYCYLWEKKKVWEDDYVKRPEEGEK
jgi:hypothetical protein